MLTNEVSFNKNITIQKYNYFAFRIFKAVKKYKKEKFWNGVNEDFEKLHEDKDLWNQELQERKSWDNTLLDGIGE